MRCSRLLAAAFVLVASTVVAHADTVYKYTGTDFTTANPPYSTSDFISGSFTLASPLQANQQFIDLTAFTFSFSDGVQTIDNANVDSEFFRISTDGDGNISFWTIDMVVPQGADSNGQIFTSNDDFREFADINGGATVAISSAVGHWTITNTAPPAVPEPSSIALLGTGVLGLAGIARRKFLSHS